MLTNQDTQTQAQLRLDIEAVVNSRVPAHIRRWIPTSMIRALERVIHQADMNKVLDDIGHLRGAEFCNAIIERLDATYEVVHADRLPESGRAIFVCNHPLGALDGIVMIDFLTRRYGTPVKFVVNDLLMVLVPLRDVFMPVNKHGKQSRESSETIDTVMAGDTPVIMFPAGMVSRKQRGVVADLRWQKMFIHKALLHNRPVVPIHFAASNSRLFYNFARLRERLGITFNLEMILLPREIFRSYRSHFKITIGHPIAPSHLAGGAQSHAEAQRIRELVYTLPNDQQ